MIYTVVIKERYGKNVEGITLKYYTLEDVMNIIALMSEGQSEYHNIEIRITAEPDPNLAKVERVD